MTATKSAESCVLNTETKGPEKYFIYLFKINRKILPRDVFITRPEAELSVERYV